MSAGNSPFSLFRYGLAVIQSFAALFSTGAVLFGAHTLFLRYYAREWEGLQFSGVNGCAGVEHVVNGDLFDGQTLCNRPENFVPWIEIYRRHWDTATAYYGLIFIVILAVGALIMRLQRGHASPAPYGAAAPAPSPEHDEHLR